MRIAHIVSHAALNGVATSCRTLIEAQLAAGHDVFLAVSPKSWLADRLDLDRITVLESRFKTRPAEIARVGYAIRDWGADVVHCHGSRANKYGLVYRFAGRTPVVATAHASLFQLPWRWFHAVIAPSRATAEFHKRKNLVPRKRLREVANAVAAGPVDPAGRQEAKRRARRLLGIDDADFVLGCVGTISRLKNQVDILRAMAALPPSAGRVRLVLVGPSAHASEPIEGWDQALAAAGTSHDVMLTGPRPDGAVISAAFDVFVFASMREQGPIAPLEAMANGVPVVTYAVGNLPEIIDTGSTGIVVPQGAVEALTEALSELVRDRSRGVEMGERAAAVVRERFSPAAMQAATLDVYRSVMRHGRETARTTG
jgi:L-malate glycosyltransferase